MHCNPASRITLCALAGLFACLAPCQDIRRTVLGDDFFDDFRSAFAPLVPNGHTDLTLKGNYEYIDQSKRSGRHLQYADDALFGAELQCRPKWARGWFFDISVDHSPYRFVWHESPVFNAAASVDNFSASGGRDVRLGRLSFEIHRNTIVAEGKIPQLSGVFGLFTGAPSYNLGESSGGAELTLESALSQQLKSTLRIGYSAGGGGIILKDVPSGTVLRMPIGGRGLDALAALRWQRSPSIAWSLLGQASATRGLGTVSLDGYAIGTSSTNETSWSLGIANEMTRSHHSSVSVWADIGQVSDAFTLGVPIADYLEFKQAPAGSTLFANLNYSSFRYELGGELTQNHGQRRWTEALRIARQPTQLNSTAQVAQFLNYENATGNVDESGLWIVTPSAQYQQEFGSNWFRVQLKQVIPIITDHVRSQSVPPSGGPKRLTLGGLLVEFSLGIRF